MEDVAIIGMACIFPGAPDLKSYWENIVGKVDCTGDPPAEWEPQLYFDAERKANDRTYCKRGGYLGDLARFDPFELGVMPNSLDGGEPDHFLSLRVANEALEDAGYSRHTVDSRRTEVIVGRGTYINRGITNMFQHGVVVDQTLDIIAELHPEYGPEDLAKIKARLKDRLPPLNSETIASLVPNVLSGRIANRLNLMGGNYIVDAACASSLIAVEQGVNDLVVGKCDMALVGGVNASLPPPILMIFSQIDALSRKQRLRAFDAEADGTLLGEGLGFVVLKRRADAERDGDRIYANLKGVGIASDGRVQGLLAPWVEGQALAIRRAYAKAGISPENVELVECHGTGVPLGDRTELQSLSQVFGSRAGDRPSCAIGTVKSQIGHLLTAAGMAGLIKAVLSLHHKVLPPTLGVERPNPELELEKTPFYLNTEARPWIHGDGSRPRQAAVNAFGFGGINAHAILEEHVETVAALGRPNLNRDWDSEVFLVRASSRAKLVERIAALRALLESERSFALADLAYTLNTGAAGEQAGTACLSLVATSRDDLDKKLAHAAARLAEPERERINDRKGIYYFEEPLGREGRVAFLMPGEGSQYENMLADLCMHFPEVRASFDLLDRAFVERERSYLPSHTIFPLPLGADQQDAERLWAMDSAAESVFAANQAMATLMRRLGVRPDAYLGHSTGEYSVMLAAGMIPVADEQGFIEFVLGVNAVYERLSAEGRIAGGVLLTVGAVDRDHLAELVEASAGELHVAMENCPNQLVLCGSEAAIAAVEGTLRAEGAMVLRLPFARAYHTPLFRPVSDALREHFEGIDVRAPETEVYSCTTAAPYPRDPDAIRELATSQWSSTVRFQQSIEAMYTGGVRVFLEVGPRSNLSAFVADVLRKRPHLALATNLHTRSGTEQVNHVVAQLAAHGVDVDPAALYEHRDPQTVSLEPLEAGASLPEAFEHLRRIQTVLPRVRLGSPPLFERAPVAGVDPVVTPSETPRHEPATPVRTAGTSPPAHEAAPATPGVFGVRDAVGPLEPALGTDERSRVLAEYLRGMEEFLDANDRVLTSLFAAGGAGPLANGASGNGASSAVTTRTRPFVRDVVTLTDERAIVCCTLDLDEDAYLRDHTLGGRHVSRADLDLTGLPILPLTFTMEALCEVAELLAPGQELVGMREVRGYRWIALDRQRPKRLQLSATRTGDGRIAAQVRELAEGADPHVVERGLPLAEAVVEFAAARPPAPAAGTFALEGARPSNWKEKDLYDGFMFHGESLRSVARVESFGESGSVSVMRAVPEEPLFRSRERTDFVSDGVVLDGAGQAVAYWTSDHLDRGYHVFPFRLEGLRVHGAPFAFPEEAECRIQAQLVGDEQVRSDIELVDGQGRVRMHLDGWWDRRFAMPEGFARFLAHPQRALLSTAWPELPACLAAVGATARRVVAPGPDFFRVHDGLWERVVAHVVLGRAEREEWAARAGQDEHRLRWLLGRVAAKEAVRELLAHRDGVDVLPADIRIGNDAAGRPVVVEIVGATSVEHAGTATRLPAISIAHKAGVAVAAAADLEPGLGLGVDVETERAVDDAFVRGAFDAAERGRIAFGDPGQVLRAWCAKEAFAKALGTGFSGAPTNVAIEGFDAATQRFDVSPVGALADALPQLAGLRTPVYALRFDELLLAACVCRNK